MKICSVCGQLKPLSEYYECPTGKDGYFRHCKLCYRERRVARYHGEVIETPERSDRWMLTQNENRGEIKHGTLVAYSYRKCRCAPCRKAKSEYTRSLNRFHKKYKRVSTKRVLAHIESLGVSDLVIARASGVARSRIYHIRKQQSITPEVEQKLLSLTTEDVRAAQFDGLVPASRSRRLINDLKQSGFTRKGIGALFGLAQSKILRGRQVRISNARRIEKVYRSTGVAA